MTEDRLINFFLREIEAEALSGFARLARIPDTRVMTCLEYYRRLNDEDRRAFRDCSAHRAASRYAFVVGAPPIDYTRHPFFGTWRPSPTDSLRHEIQRSVPSLRATVQQYKSDAHRGIVSHVSQAEFEFASSIQSIKATELRKRVRAALQPLGYYKVDELGFYRCRSDGREFLVHADFGGRNAQLRYCVAFSEFKGTHPLSQFIFESTLGFGIGDWDYIVKDNVDDVFSLFGDVVRYCIALPDHIRAAAG